MLLLTRRAHARVKFLNSSNNSNSNIRVSVVRTARFSCTNAIGELSTGYAALQQGLFLSAVTAVLQVILVALFHLARTHTAIEFMKYQVVVRARTRGKTSVTESLVRTRTKGMFS